MRSDMQALPTPLARLCAVAMEAGLTVAEHDVTTHGPWPDDEVAAAISECGVVALAPDMDEGLHADVLAFAIAVGACLSEKWTTDSDDGMVLIGRERVPGGVPVTGPGRLATFLARGAGRETLSAAFTTQPPLCAPGGVS